MTTKSTKAKPFRDVLREGKRVFQTSAIRRDGWENALTGLGGARDKATATRFTGNGWLSDQEITDLFSFNDFARTVIVTFVEDALREGFKPTITGDESPENEKKIKAVCKELERLDVHGKVFKAAVLGRAYGGARIIVGARGAGKPDRPMRDDLVKGIEFLNVLDRRSLSPRTYYDDPLAPKFGEVSTFHVHPITRSTAIRMTVHETRMLSFAGALTEDQTKEHRQGWDLSVLDPVYAALKSTGQNWTSIDNMLSDASQAIYKIKGLIETIAEDDHTAFTTRMELIDIARSIARAMILDKDEEDFSFTERSFAGLSDLIDKFFLRVAAAARMPVTRLLGQSPAGLNATGAIDLRLWYDSVRVYQRDGLTPPLESIVRMIVRGLFPGDDVEAWGIEWPSLWQMTSQEEADYHGKIADTDVKYLNAGVILPEEVALSRFNGGKIQPGYSAVDLEHKRAMLEISQEDEKNPPPPPPMLGGPPGAPLDPNADPEAEQKPGKPPTPGKTAEDEPEPEPEDDEDA